MYIVWNWKGFELPTKRRKEPGSRFCTDSKVRPHTFYIFKPCKFIYWEHRSSGGYLRLVVFSRRSGFLHQWNWPPRNMLNVVLKTPEINQSINSKFFKYGGLNLILFLDKPLTCITVDYNSIILTPMLKQNKQT